MTHVRDVSLVPVRMQVTPGRDNVTLAISKDYYSKPGQATLDRFRAERREQEAPTPSSGFDAGLSLGHSEEAMNARWYGSATKLLRTRRRTSFMTSQATTARSARAAISGLTWGTCRSFPKFV